MKKNRTTPNHAEIFERWNIALSRSICTIEKIEASFSRQRARRRGLRMHRFYMQAESLAKNTPDAPQLCSETGIIDRRRRGVGADHECGMGTVMSRQE
jgi:hypothetical protein